VHRTWALSQNSLSLLSVLLLSFALLDISTRGASSAILAAGSNPLAAGFLHKPGSTPAAGIAEQKQGPFQLVAVSSPPRSPGTGYGTTRNPRFEPGSLLYKVICHSSLFRPVSTRPLEVTTTMRSLCRSNPAPYGRMGEDGASARFTTTCERVIN
jgi:hypothetical protein